MNEPSVTPRLGEEQLAELPVRPLLSPYFILRTPLGGYYLDPQYNLQLVRNPHERLARFLAEAARQTSGGGLGEVRYKTARPDPRPLRYLNDGAIREFEEAAREFLARGQTADQALLRGGLRLPDPGVEPDAYWVCGERFSPQLMVLWGCEREEGSSLPLTGKGRTVVSELRARAMSWGRLFREGIELTCQQDDLRQFLAFPVLDEKGHLTHVKRWVGGQFVADDVKRRWYEFWKIRPLKAASAGSVREFERAARAFYRKAHPTGCHCPVCARGGAEGSGVGAEGAAAAAPSAPALTYEQEVRRGFQLPDPDRHPGAYLVHGKPFAGKVLILLPYPEIKDADEIQRLEQELEKTKNKELQQRIKQRFDGEIQRRNEYRDYLLEADDCLCLVEDRALGLPRPVVEEAPASSTAPSLAVPAKPVPVKAAEAAGDTVAAKLRLRCVRWGRIGLTVLVLVAMGAMGAYGYYLWKPKSVNLSKVEAADGVEMDPDNARNRLRLTFANALAGKGPWGNHTLKDAANTVLNTVRLADPNQLLVQRAQGAFKDGVTYTVLAQGTRDTWGNVLAATNSTFKYEDRRKPSLRGIPIPASEQSDYQILVEADEPLDAGSLQTNTSISITGMPLARPPELAKEGLGFILTTKDAFEPGKQYTVEVQGVRDECGRNAMDLVRTNFTYAQVPLRMVRPPSATVDQLHVVAEFNRLLNPQSVQTLGTFKIDGMQILTVLPRGDGRAVEIVLTNVVLKPDIDYTLMVARVRSQGGDELTTNVTFRYIGPVDTVAPKLQNVTLVSKQQLDLAWSEDLQQKPMKVGDFTLERRVDSSWASAGQRLTPRWVDPRTLRLETSSDVPIGAYRIRYYGVHDLVGNSKDGEYAFTRGGLMMGPTQLRKGTLVGADGLRLVLSGLIDTNNTTAANFVLKTTAGAEVPGVTIRDVKVRHLPSDTPSRAASEVDLTLSGRLPEGASAYYKGLKFQGDVVPWNDPDMPR